MVTSIQDISQTFASLERPIGNRWHLHALTPNRLHLSVSHDGAPTLFIEGDADSFGNLPTLRGLEHREDAIDVQTGNVFKALRITAPQEPYGDEALAFIAYEICRIIESDPDTDNGALLAGVYWILKVLGIETSVLSGERQRGLVAELLLLRRLLQLGREHSVGSQVVLDRWWGPVGGKRDFAAVGISIEVKSTALNTRTHHIASIDQLDPMSPGEQVYVYSVGIKSEPTVDRKLPTYVADCVSAIADTPGRVLVGTAVHSFYQKLESAGYLPRLGDLYRSEPGVMPNPLLPPKLFRASDLDRLRMSSFKENSLPSMVTAVSYEINISAPPLGERDVDAALLSLITSPGL